MTATPAQIANDLAAQAQFWQRRDDHAARACRDCSRLIRAMIAGEAVDGRTYHGLYGRLMNLETTWRSRDDRLWNSLARGRLTLETLKRARQT